MSPAILTAISTVLGALISGVVAIVVSAHQHDKSMALIEYRIKELEEKMDKHNNLVERVAITERDLKTAFKRIDETRDDVRNIK